MPLPHRESFDYHPSLEVEATYELANDRVYIRFSNPPQPALTTAIKALGMQCRPQWGVWLGHGSLWPELKKILGKAGIKLIEGRLRKLTVAEAEAENSPTLADFDWSGFPKWAEENLKIIPKLSTGFVPFVLNKPQRKAFDQAWRQWQRTGMVRQNNLKNRQVGLSTMWQALFFYISLHIPGTEALVTAHRSESSDAVFQRTTNFERFCPQKRPTRRNNKKEIQWEAPHGSALRVGLAGDDEDFGRSTKRDMYHASEAALYNDRGLAAYGNIMQSIADIRGTIVIRETTAKGQNWFYDSWTAPEAEGFENFFTGWLDDDTCRLYGIGLDDPCWEKIPRQWKEDEGRLRAIAQNMGMAEAEMIAALVWRRRWIPARCKGSTKVFNRENPTVPEDAFTSTGGHVFDIEIVDVERKKAEAVEREKPAKRFSLTITDQQTGEYKLERNEVGPLRMWKSSGKDQTYFVTGDFGRGRNVAGDTGDPDKLDYTTMGVVNELTLEEVAVWHGRMDPDEAADQMAALGKIYNGAMLVPETNHYGMILIAKLVKIRKYGRVYLREKVDRATIAPIQQSIEAHWMEYGWWTTPQSKPNMIEWLHEAIRDRTFTIHEPEFWDEARTYMRDEDGGTDAESGRHDDRVLRMAIAASYVKLHKKIVRHEVRPTPAIEVVTKDGQLGLQINFPALVAQDRQKREMAKGNVEDCN